MIRKHAAVFPSTGTACPGEVVLSRVGDIGVGLDESSVIRGKF